MKEFLQATNQYEKIVLILTATIDPRTCVHVARRDPDVRRADYLSAFAMWLEDSPIRNIIVCENSGTQLDDFRCLAARHPNKNVNVIECPVMDAGSRGKSYGEIKLIDCALRELPTVCGALKVSGRYFVKNVARLMWRASNPSVALLSWPMLVGGLIPSEIFYGSRDFIDRYLLPRAEWIDESAGRYFEGALALAGLAAGRDGLLRLVYDIEPEVEGISATRGRPFDAHRSTRVPLLLDDGSVEVEGSQLWLRLGQRVLERFMELPSSVREAEEYDGVVKKKIDSILGRRGARLILAPEDIRIIIKCGRTLMTVYSPTAVEGTLGMTANDLARLCHHLENSLWCVSKR